MKSPKKHILVNAAEVRDATPFAARPGAVWIRPDRSIGAAGQPEAVREVMNDELNGDNGQVRVIDRLRHLVLPALVNAHTHLDLSHLGPRPTQSSFVEWANMIRGERATEVDAIRASVRKGIELSRRGGVGMVGDISGIGSLVPIEELAASGLHGVGFVELFGQGTWQEQAIRRMQDMLPELAAIQAKATRVRCGLQPHAPYSAGRMLYSAAVGAAREHNLRLATHLAETAEEIEFTTSASGPFVGLLQSIGKWDPSIVATNLHPIDYLQDILESAESCGGWALAHVNYADDVHIEILSRSRSSVIYCPRASAYFGHSDHRYREMIEAGIPVAVGTDSIICLDTPDRLSTLDEMRLLYRRDNADPNLLLRMATITGASVLGFDPDCVALNRSTEPVMPIIGLCAIPIDPNDDTDALEQALRSDSAIELIPFDK